MLVLMGKATSGKDAVLNKLIDKYGFHKIVTYTTRPMRDNEIADITYHYISKEEFQNKISDGFFAEYKQYIVGDDVWYYGSAKEDLLNADDKSIIILTPEGVKDIQNNSVKAIVIYLYANLTTIKKRLHDRKDKNDKEDDRIARDIKAFKDAEQLANKIVYNNDGTDLETVVENVLTQYEEVKKCTMD